VMAKLWGTRGSIATPGAETTRYGGNTSCVEVRGSHGTLLVLDAGTGIRRLGAQVASVGRVDVLLTHLHMDHIQGLGFFRPLDEPGREVHIWGPPSTTLSLGARLSRYLSPPLFPVRLRDLPCRLTLHDVPLGHFEIEGLEIVAALVYHPGPTVGYRITENEAAIAFGTIRKKYFIICDIDSAITKIVLSDFLADKVVALLWAVAAESLAVAEFIHRLVHRFDDRRRQRLGYVADPTPY